MLLPLPYLIRYCTRLVADGGGGEDDDDCDLVQRRSVEGEEEEGVTLLTKLSGIVEASGGMKDWRVREDKTRARGYRTTAAVARAVAVPGAESIAGGAVAADVRGSRGIVVEEIEGCGGEQRKEVADGRENGGAGVEQEGEEESIDIEGGRTTGGSEDGKEEDKDKSCRDGAESGSRMWKGGGDDGGARTTKVAEEEEEGENALVGEDGGLWRDSRWRYAGPWKRTARRTWRWCS